MSFIGPARPTTTTTSNENDKDTNNNDKKRLMDDNCKNTNTNNNSDSSEILSVEPPPKRLMVGPKQTDNDNNNKDNNNNNNTDNDVLSPQPPPPSFKKVMGPRLDDDYNGNKTTLGPQPPPTTNNRVMGPRLNKDDSSNNSKTTVGPQIPQKRVMGPRLDDESSSNKHTVGPQIPSRNRVMGPSIGPSFNKDDDSSSDDEDKDIKSEWERVRNDNTNNNDGSSVKVSKREEWMTQLPTGRIDSTSNRQFSQKGNVSKPIIGPGLTNNDEADEKKKVFEKLRQKETEEKMRSYNDKNRSESLLSMHAQKNKQSNLTNSTTGKKEFSFNRDEELKIGTVDKEHLNNIVRGSTSLNDKFGKSNWM